MDNEEYRERLDLVKERLKGVAAGEMQVPAPWEAYFKAQASLLLLLEEISQKITEGSVTMEDRRGWNRGLYEDILPEHYDESFCDPAYAASVLGEKNGAYGACIAAEMRSAIPCVFEGENEELLIRMEWILEFLSAVENTAQDGEEEQEKAFHDVLYYFVRDYYEDECRRRVAHMVDPSLSFGRDIVMNADLTTPDYLYLYGEYISENEIKLAEYIASLPDERIQKIADTFSEGYRIGFVTTGKDLSIKKTVNVRYPLGMERIIRRAVENFKAMGLESVLYRATGSLFTGRSVQKMGYFGANPNPQYDYDHREDIALILDGQLVTRRLECMEEGYKAYQALAKGHAGPAVMEVFGEKPFVPRSKEAAPKFDPKQRKLMVRDRTEAAAITNRYIPGEERSFTIISFPVPAIGEKFPEIFDAVYAINTLDYKKYQRIQQRLCDALNEAVAIHVKGMGANRTDLKVSLYALTDPEKQAIYENCVADVNIPVGEVFTTPVLEGTEGLLHVSRVYLNGLEYKGIYLKFQDGMVVDYGCENFPEEEKNRRYIEENVLFHHKALPMGEAAIGTNTTAYVLSRKLDFEERLPILIAEKTGPHFAIGDTCYSHAEDLPVYNPDGKEIVARDNSISSLRKSTPEKAYFGCHTDVTIPYDELGLLEGIRSDGSRIEIIREGRFVLPGTEELNEPFGE